MEYSGGRKKLLWSLPPSSCLFFSMKTHTTVCNSAAYSPLMHNSSFPKCQICILEIIPKYVIYWCKGGKTLIFLVLHEQSFCESVIFFFFFIKMKISLKEAILFTARAHRAAYKSLKVDESLRLKLTISSSVYKTWILTKDQKIKKAVKYGCTFWNICSLI